MALFRIIFYFPSCTFQVLFKVFKNYFAYSSKNVLKFYMRFYMLLMEESILCVILLLHFGHTSLFKEIELIGLYFHNTKTLNLCIQIKLYLELTGVVRFRDSFRTNINIFYRKIDLG